MIKKIVMGICLFAISVSNGAAIHAEGQEETIKKTQLNPHNSSPRGLWVSASTIPFDQDSLLSSFLAAYPKVTHEVVDVMQGSNLLNDDRSVDILYIESADLAEITLRSVDTFKDLAPVYLLYGEALDLSDAIILSLGDSEGLYGIPVAVQVTNMIFVDDAVFSEGLNDWESFFSLAEQRKQEGSPTIHIDGKQSLVGLWESLLLSALGEKRYTAVLHGISPIREKELTTVHELFLQILDYGRVLDLHYSSEFPVVYSVDPATNFKLASVDRFKRQPIPATDDLALLRMVLVAVPQSSKSDTTNAMWIRYINRSEQLDQRMQTIIQSEQNYLVPQKNNAKALNSDALRGDALQYSTATHALSVLHGGTQVSLDRLADILFQAVASEDLTAETLTQRISELFAQ